MNFEILDRPKRAMEQITVSVIIPILNEEKAIERCFDSLARLDFPKASFEVILVDNGSTDGSLEKARAFSSLLNLTILRQRGVHVSSLRNLGASQARGSIFAFLDGDCVVPPIWLKRASALLAEQGAGVVGAHFRIPDDSRWVARVWYGTLQFEKQGDLSWVPGCNTVVSRAVFERVGGFDASIETNEDCEFCDRIRAEGLRVVGDPACAVVHLGTPQTLGSFYRKMYWHGTDGLRVFVKTLPRISNARPLLFAVYTLLCLIGAVVGVERLIARRQAGLLIGFVVALCMPAFLLSLRLTARRKKWRDLFPLALLNLVYGVARAGSLFILWNRSGRDNHNALLEGDHG